MLDPARREPGFAEARSSMSLELQDFADAILPLLIAFALSFPLGWERGAGRASTGFRTLPIVAMGSCAFALVARDFPDASGESMTRLLQGLMGGIGFIGGGAILKDNGSVKGLATAASVWNVAAIGAAVAFDRIEIALMLSAIHLVTLLLLTPLAKEVGESDERD